MVIKVGKIKYRVKEIFKETDSTQQQKEPDLSNANNGNAANSKEHPIETNQNAKGGPHENSREEEDKKEDSIEDHNNIRIITEEEKPISALNVSPNIDVQKALQETKDVNICRICQSEDNTLEDPLISPCKCAGSIKYIHAKCMQEWYKSKLVSRCIRNTSSYSIRGLECELCKQRFSMSIEHKGKIIDLINICRPKTGAYIVIESVGEKVVTHVHITAMENKRSIRIGRGRDSDISISDNTVSRCHATIKYIDGEYYLNDNNSKFGTCIIAPGEAVLDDDTVMWVQIGRTVLNLLALNPAGSSVGCCSSSTKVKKEHSDPAPNTVVQAAGRL